MVAWLALQIGPFSELTCKMNALSVDVWSQPFSGHPEARAPCIAWKLNTGIWFCTSDIEIIGRCICTMLTMLLSFYIDVSNARIAWPYWGFLVQRIEKRHDEFMRKQVFHFLNVGSTHLLIFVRNAIQKAYIRRLERESWKVQCSNIATILNQDIEWKCSFFKLYPYDC